MAESHDMREHYLKQDRQSCKTISKKNMSGEATHQANYQYR